MADEFPIEGGGELPGDNGGGSPIGSMGTGSDGSWWQNFSNSLSGLSPSMLAALLGAAGPTAGLIGSLVSGGQGPTQTGTTNQQQSQSGTTNTQGSQQSNQAGFQNTTSTPSLDRAGSDAESRLNALLGGNASGAQGAYSQGLSMLQQLATGVGNGTMGSGSIARPNTTPQAGAVSGFPTALPTEYNQGLGNLIKQAFGSFVGDLGSDAITNARGRGFAGGADLLGSAAAPMMGQSLAQVPSMEAKAYLDHVLQAYGLQTQNAAAQNNAQSQALNAATNALGPGVATYGIDKQSANQQLANVTSLLQALMGPQQMMMQGNTALLNAAPRSTTQNTLTGSSGTQSSLSGTQTAGNSMSQGNTSGTSTTPMGTVIGQGLGNIAQGAATGVAAQQNRDASVAAQQSLLNALAGRNG